MFYLRIWVFGSLGQGAPFIAFCDRLQGILMNEQGDILDHQIHVFWWNLLRTWCLFGWLESVGEGKIMSGVFQLGVSGAL